MKKLLTLNTKWILTASLLSLLVTQYSNQSSSLSIAKAHAQYSNSGEYVLASRVPADVTTTTSTDASTATTTSNDATAAAIAEFAAANSTSSDASKTEASANTEGACTEDCETPSTDQKTIQDLVTRISSLENMLKQLKEAQPTAPTTTTAAAEENDSDCEKPEANASRDDKREYAKCIKDEKEQIRKDKIKEKFEDRVADLEDKCDKDLECLSSGLTSLLSRFTGKNAPAAADVNKAFRSLMAAPLAAALYSDNPEVLESTLASLQGLMQDMPDDYRSLKQSIMNAVKNQATVAAKKVSDGYARLQTLSQQNNPQAYFETLQETKLEEQKLTYLSNSYSSSIEQSLQMTNDVTTLSYYQKSYVPDMKKILASMMAPTQPTTTQPGATPGVGRDGRSGQQTVTTSTTPAVQDPNKMIRGDQVWTFPTSNSGISIGTPSTTPTLRGRGPQRQQ